MKYNSETGELELPFIRSANNYDADAASDASAICCDPDSDTGRSKTVQSQKDEADINVIVKRFGLTGHMPVGLQAPQYIDYDGVFDFQSAMNVVLDAQQTFMKLPAEVRDRFANSPQRFMEFCTAETDDGKLKNFDEMKKMGLTTPEKPAIVPQKVEITNTEIFQMQAIIQELKAAVRRLESQRKLVAETRALVEYAERNSMQITASAARGKLQRHEKVVAETEAVVRELEKASGAFNFKESKVGNDAISARVQKP